MRLTLKFWRDGGFDGDGEDEAGRFTVDCKQFSQYLPSVRFIKTYAGHKFVYQGFFSSKQRGMVGIWHDGQFGEQGTFALWPGRVMRAMGVKPTEDDITDADLAAMPHLDDRSADCLSPAIVELAARCHRDGEASTTLRSLLGRSGKTHKSHAGIRDLRFALQLVKLLGSAKLSTASMDQPIHLKPIRHTANTKLDAAERWDREIREEEAKGDTTK